MGVWLRLLFSLDLGNDGAMQRQVDKGRGRGNGTRLNVLIGERYEMGRCGNTSFERAARLGVNLGGLSLHIDRSARRRRLRRCPGSWS